MPPSPLRSAEPGEVVVEVAIACRELMPTVDFFVERLGFRLILISPADNPTAAVVEAGGTRLRIVAAADERSHGSGDTTRLRMRRDQLPGPVVGDRLIAPNGTVVEIVEAAVAEPAAVEPTLVVTRAADGAPAVGRAGMQYRDLLPDRHGGRFIVSHITIPDGGPVPDYVHHHDIRFQLIFCHRGWVRVVYEGQGEPFELGPGDGVLQPPGMRHRVLAASPGLEVIEVSSPAEHDTYPDPDLALPSAPADPRRRYRGQRFVHHRAAAASWTPVAGAASLEITDTGVAAATDGLAAVRVLRARGRACGLGERLPAIGTELDLHVVLAGTATLVTHGVPGNEATEREAATTDHAGIELGVGDAVSLPPSGYALAGWSDDVELLEVVLPAAERGSTGSGPPDVGTHRVGTS